MDQLKQVDRVADLLSTQRHQLTIQIAKEQSENMMCRFKDFFYLGVIILLTMGVWYSYSQASSQEESEWSWMEDDQPFQEDEESYTGRTDEDQDYLYGGAHNILGEDHASEAIAYFNAGFDADLNEADDPESPHIPLDELWDTQQLLNPQQFAPAIQSEKAYISSENAYEEANEQYVLETKPEQSPSELHQLSLESVVLPPVEEEVLNKPSEVPAQPKPILPSLVISETEGETREQWAHYTKPTGSFSKPRIVLRSTDPTKKEDSGEDKIPKIIHQAWDVMDIPMSFSPFVQSWILQNPGWEYWFWTPNDVQTLINSSYPQFVDLFNSDQLSVVDRANIMRYFIIHAHGGVFAELDMECLKSIDSWTVGNTCFLVEEPREHSYLINQKLEGNVFNALMACVPHHPFYEVILHALPEHISTYYGDENRATGSFFIDEVFRAFRKHPLPESLAHYGEVVLIEPEYFIPRYDEKNWAAINSACNTNIVDMPFHVSWLCTVWIRNRMQTNEAFPHSYTDHHWIDVESELGLANIATVPIMAVIKSVLSDATLGHPILPTVQELENVAASKYSSAEDMSAEAQNLAAAYQQQEQQGQVIQSQSQQQQPAPPQQAYEEPRQQIVPNQPYANQILQQASGNQQPQYIPQQPYDDPRQQQQASYLSLLRQNSQQNVAPVPPPAQPANYPYQAPNQAPAGPSQNYQQVYQGSDSRVPQGYVQSGVSGQQGIGYHPQQTVNNGLIQPGQYAVPMGAPAPVRVPGYPVGEVYPEGFSPNNGPPQVVDPSQGIPQQPNYIPT